MPEAKTRKPPKVACHGSACVADGVKHEQEDLTMVGKRRLCAACQASEASALEGIEAVTLPNRSRVFDQLPDVKVEGWPSRKGRLSPSELGTFLACPEKWRKERILGRRSLSDGKQIAGTAAHAAVEAYYTHKLEGEILDPRVVEVTARAAFEAEVERLVGPKGPGVIDWQEAFPHDVAREAAGFMAAAYVEKVGHRVEPISMEALTIVTVPGVPIPVSSIADLIGSEDGRPPAIIDYKFGGKAHTDHGAWWKVQGLVQQIGRDLPCEWHSVDHKGNVNTPSSHPGLRVERTPERFLIGSNLVRSVYQSIMLYLEAFGPYGVWPGALSDQNACNMCSLVNECSWWTAEEWSKSLVSLDG